MTGAMTGTWQLDVMNAAGLIEGSASLVVVDDDEVMTHDALVEAMTVELGEMGVDLLDGAVRHAELRKLPPPEKTYTHEELRRLAQGVA